MRYILEVWKLGALEHLTGHQVAGSIPVWGSGIVFLRIKLDERLSIISRYLQAPTLLKCISQFISILFILAR